MRPKYRVDERLKDYATETQKRYVDAVNMYGSMREASRRLGVNFTTVHQSLNALERVAARRGFAPSHDMTHPAPSPFVVKGVSTLYDESGAQKLQWVKTKLDDWQVEQVLKDFVQDLMKDVKGTSRLVPEPKHADSDLLAVYPLGDPHFGMYAWKAEAGQDFDTEIAESITTAAIDRLVASAPDAEHAVFLPLGDILHADDTKNRTPQSGNILDVDTRHQRVLLVAVKAMKHGIYRLLEKHKRVTARFVGGNHDPHSSFTIALALSQHFENNPRVTIDLSPAAFWYYRFGKVLIGATHGDKAKGRDLLGVMASDKPTEWGETRFRYFYHGHLHERGEKEVPGLRIEWFRTLAPLDAWAAAEGYRSGRDMYCIVMHKDFGEIERHRCDVAMIEKRATV